MGLESWSLFEALIPPTDVTRESTLNPSDGSPDGTPGAVLLGASLEEIHQKASFWLL